MNKRNHISCLEVFNDESKPWIFLFHGYGADAHDLHGLAEVLDPAGNFNWIFPNGIYEVPIGPGWTGHAWWPLKIDRLKDDISEEIPEELKSTRAKCLELVNSYKIPAEKLILGGFSQGGMLATDLCLHLPNKIRSLILLSTSLINKTEWYPLTKEKSGQNFFMAHGEQDDVLPIKGADRLHQLLKESGFVGNLLRFQGRHEIPMPVINKLQAYLLELK